MTTRRWTDWSAVIAGALALGLGGACGGGGDDGPADDSGDDAAGIDAQPAPYCTAGPGTEMRLVQVASGLSRPVGATAPSGDPRIFVLERAGYVRVVRDGILAPTPYLDVTDEILSVGDEQGLLGLAFHPQFSTNGKLYVSYVATDEHRVISEFTAAASDAATVDPSTERVLIRDPHIARDNHNGGTVTFGPDGLLYFSLGDGGGANDSENGGQNAQTLRAKILRIDVDNGDPYGIPSGRRWATAGGVSEMWAWGLRNAWQFSFDSAGQIYIGDVGQEEYEEIDIIPPGEGGLNFGWPVYEGEACFDEDSGGSAGCDNPGAYVFPAFTLDRRGQSGSITGGRVYEGTCMPDVRGTYVFADYSSGRIWTSPVSGAALTNVVDRTTEIDPGGDLFGDISAFGHDGYGELYVMALMNGRLYRFERR